MNIAPYVKAGYSILYIQTPEGDRAELQILKTCTELKRKLRIWSITEGLSDHDGKNSEQIEDPIEALNRAKSEPPGTVLIVRNFHMFLNGPKIVQQVKDISRDFKQTQKTLIILSAIKKLPPELERDITVIEFDLPTRTDIEFIFDGLYSEGAKKKLGEIEPDERERIIQAAMGLTAIEAENALAKALVEFGDNKKTNTNSYPISKLVMKEKANAVKKSGILEYFEVKQGVSDIGGLENLKEWLTIRSKAFSKKARDFGIPMPRGILLVGLPGCGKSLSARISSNILNIPLLRFDIGKVFGGLVGESERNMRTAIQTTEAVGSCVLWIDEMEKAFAGMSGSSTDGGTSQRVFGNFITWMQEKTTPCFIIATVNRIESLPPELLRKGRFDEMFFVGLPSPEERKAIFKIHTLKYGKNSFKEKDLQLCASESEGFSGAEIEESVVTGLYSAFYHDRNLEVDDVVNAIKNTNPLSKSKKAELDAMAAWASSNAINASKISKEKSVHNIGRQLEL